MSTFWRIALAWMLALALPLQGHAAQRLLASAFSPVLAGVEHIQARDAAGEPGLHEGLMTGLASAHASHCDQTAAAADGDPAKPASTGSCSACASCCHAAALPPAVPQLPLMPLALPEAPEFHLALAFVWLDGLERPPRPALR
ncbi:hypothetical protein [Roseateles flavus]|uniref:DUF2946 domain-containing protein n=1 Tax=Roseateles flavus TaxID=3149041 RepID=A0ABV0GF36_9BURK